MCALVQGTRPSVVRLRPEGWSRRAMPPPGKQVDGYQLPPAQRAVQQAGERTLLAAWVGLYFSKPIKDLEQPALLNGPESI